MMLSFRSRSAGGDGKEPAPEHRASDHPVHRRAHFQRYLLTAVVSRVPIRHAAAGVIARPECHGRTEVAHGSSRRNWSAKVKFRAVAAAYSRGGRRPMPARRSRRRTRSPPRGLIDASAAAGTWSPSVIVTAEPDQVLLALGPAATGSHGSPASKRRTKRQCTATCVAPLLRSRANLGTASPAAAPRLLMAQFGVTGKQNASREPSGITGSP